MIRIEKCRWGYKEGMPKEAFLYLVCGKPATRWLAFDAYGDDIAGLCDQHFSSRMATHRSLISLVGNFAPVTQVREITYKEAVISEIMKT